VPTSALFFLGDFSRDLWIVSSKGGLDFWGIEPRVILRKQGLACYDQMGGYLLGKTN